MGCFLACFGFSKKKRRRKSASKVAAGDHRRGSYMPLDSSLNIVGGESGDGAKESPNSAGSELRDEPKEQTRVKTRKKVSFNLNVQTYEPISTNYHFLENHEEEEMAEETGREVSKGSLSTSLSKRDSTAWKMGLFPSNYRYQNVRDSYDEEDIAYEESDLDDNDNNYDDDDDDYDDDYEIDDQRISQEGLSKQFSSASTNGELEYPSARDNIQHHVHSVLSPVENLTQWKAAKTKAVAAPKQQKENMALSQQPRMPPPYSIRSNCSQSKLLLQEIPVHASLSSWINSQSTN